MKLTVKVVLDVDTVAWQKQYPADGPSDARDRASTYIRHLVARSHPATQGLWRVIEHPSEAVLDPTVTIHGPKGG